jgi:hypothetical protein
MAYEKLSFPVAVPMLFIDKMASYPSTVTKTYKPSGFKASATKTRGLLICFTQRHWLTAEAKPQ